MSQSTVLQCLQDILYLMLLETTFSFQVPTHNLCWVENTLNHLEKEKIQNSFHSQLQLTTSIKDQKVLKPCGIVCSPLPL